MVAQMIVSDEIQLAMRTSHTTFAINAAAESVARSSPRQLFSSHIFFRRTFRNVQSTPVPERRFPIQHRKSVVKSMVLHLSLSGDFTVSFENKKSVTASFSILSNTCTSTTVHWVLLWNGRWTSPLNTSSEILSETYTNRNKRNIYRSDIKTSTTIYWSIVYPSSCGFENPPAGPHTPCRSCSPRPQRSSAAR